MTKIIFAVIDNHRKIRKTCYDIIYKSEKYEEFEKYIKEKGLN